MLKIERLREGMSKLGLDAVFIHNEINQRYLTEFEYSDGLLLVTMTRCVVITDFRYYEAALSKLNGEFEVFAPKKRDEFIVDLFEKEGIAVVGLEGSFVSYKDYQACIEAYSKQTFRDIGDLMDRMRSIKSADEIEKMQHAQEITDFAFSQLLSRIKPDMTEIEVAAELEYAMKCHGAEGFAFQTIAVSGEASALPHGVPRNVPLKHGFLTMDFVAKFDGYCSDMTRTIVIGRSDAEMKHLYNTVLTAQSKALEYLEYGRDCAEADKAARDAIDVFPEYSGAFGHSLGHSVGMNVHESPSLSPRACGKTLVPGNVVTVEPGIYLFGKYGCRIEDMVMIGEEGIYNFTQSTKEIIEII